MRMHNEFLRGFYSVLITLASCVAILAVVMLIIQLLWGAS